MSSILVVDDEQSICWGISRIGESLGHEVVAAPSAEQGLDQARQRDVDVVVLDVRLPGIDGLDAIRQFQRTCRDAAIIVITAFGDLQTAVEAIHRGAFDYLVKPFDAAQIKAALARALARPSRDLLTPPLAQVDGMVGQSPQMQRVYKRIALAAASDASVLLHGESGTGKELAARAIHRYSARRDAPFVAVNVAALSETVAESELFGHVRGAFTSAEFDRAGLLAQADGGTLFLDEVADIPIPLQVKLLRAIEHREITPVGGVTPIATNFRLISATHRDLARRSEAGTFRHDLYFRLCTFQIELPPLRSRHQDIITLAEYFAATLPNPAHDDQVVIADETIEELKRRPWYGNVRELRNAIEHALIVSRGGVLLPEHLPCPVMVDAKADALGADSALIEAAARWAAAQLDHARLDGRLHETLLELVERPLFEAVLSRHKGQFASAARQLGLHRTTLRKKLSDHSERRENSPE